MESNTEVRARIRRHIATLDNKKKQQMTWCAIRRLLHLGKFHASQHIALYYPLPSELPILRLFQSCRSRNKAIYLPVTNDRSKKMQFIAYQPTTKIKPSKLGVLEPKVSLQNKRYPIPLQQLDLVVTPLLAFNYRGQRLGTGGGYYDHTFAFLQKPHRPGQPQLWGIALEYQRSQFDTHPGDIPLHGVVTESGVYRFAL